MEEDDAPRPVRRQRGSDTRVDPLPAVAPPASDAMMAFGRIAIVFTIAAWLAYVLSYFLTGIINSSYQNNERFLWETVVYVAITSFLALSALLYLVARMGALYRTRAHRRVPRAVIDESFDTSLPTMTVLVPSYREEISTIRKTLLSAALQEYPYLRVVLLLDDPPDPKIGGASRAAGERPAAVRRAHRVAGRAAGEVRRHPRAVRDLGTDRSRSGGRSRTDRGRWPTSTAGPRTGCATAADEEIIADHVDRFFADRVLGVLAADFAEVSRALTTALAEEATIPRERMLQLHRRLAWTFRGELTHFERKLYSSLSARGRTRR